MNQLRDFSDNRLINGCLYCGGPPNSREHVPPRVFLDPPFPEQLPVVWACIACNNGFSKDEAYLACLVESVIIGSTNPDDMRRERIGDLLQKTPNLHSKLEAAKSVEDGQIHFSVEPERIRRIGLKLARGHAVFELSQVRRDDPTSFWWGPLHAMSDKERDDFDAIEVLETLGEVGSRGMQRMLIVQTNVISDDGSSLNQNIVFNDWVDVQEDRYRYIAIDCDDEIRIKIVIAEYLAIEVCWDK